MIAYIPARYDSSRFPGKVLLEIGGKPLVNIVAENAAKCDYIHEVVVLADDERIVEAVKKVDYTKVRCESGTHGLSGSDRTFNYLTKHGTTDQPFVIIQADCPDLDIFTMNKFMVSTLSPSGPADAIHTLICKLDPEDADDPSNVKVVYDSYGKALYFSRAKIPYNSDTYLKHVGVYAFPHGMGRLNRNAAKFHTEAEGLEQLQWLMLGRHIQVHTADKFLRTVDVPRDYTQFSALTMK